MTVGPKNNFGIHLTDLSRSRRYSACPLTVERKSGGIEIYHQKFGYFQLHNMSETIKEKIDRLGQFDSTMLRQILGEMDRVTRALSDRMNDFEKSFIKSDDLAAKNKEIESLKKQIKEIKDTHNTYKDQLNKVS